MVDKVNGGTSFADVLDAVQNTASFGVEALTKIRQARLDSRRLDRQFKLQDRALDLDFKLASARLSSQSIPFMQVPAAPGRVAVASSPVLSKTSLLMLAALVALLVLSK